MASSTLGRSRSSIGLASIRFSAIQERFTGLSSSTLTARLQELEASGLVARSAYDEQNRVEYRLTRRGRALQQSLAVYVEYVAYRYQFDSRADLPIGVPGRLFRRGVRTGLTLWLPLIR